MHDPLGPISTPARQLVVPFHLQFPYVPSAEPAKPVYFLEQEHYERTLEAQRARNPSQNLVTRWLAGTTAPSPSGLHTPPREMNGGHANAMLAPTHGGLYNNNSSLARPSDHPYQVNAGVFTERSLATRNGQYVHARSSRPASPNQPKDVAGLYVNNTRRRESDNDNQIVSYLQIPATINDSKGSLAEFAAQITCLFWFESSFTLHRVEESKSTPLPTAPLVPEAKPSMGFRKWVTTILSTTQVTQNVILLALMFIYRLKKLNPTVKGKPGSEFRLLTVALMLGNKFLDDNTYTNKTWAEVSGISVQEIHIMEVEFLSNMKYTLYASETEWVIWHQKLGRFWNYFDKASKTAIEVKHQGLPTSLFNLTPTLPSPPASLQASPPFLAGHTLNGSAYPPSFSIPSYLAPSIPPPVVRMPEVDLRPTLRKRSYDDASQDPPAKRLARTVGHGDMPLTAPTPGAPDYNAPRLPVPNLSISTNGHFGRFPGSYSAHLPLPTGRSMSTAYPGSHQGPQSGGFLNRSSNSPGSFGGLPPMDQSRRIAPLVPNSRNVSPTSAIFPPSNSQDHLSPSGYPSQRNSPYKPLRPPNTLLVPPPSASMHNPSQHLGLNNLHYQPLGKPLSERKTGVVPYIQPDIWSQPHSHLSQSQSQWPSLPQPNFRF